MLTGEQVRESLEEVLVPGVMRSLVKLNLVRQVSHLGKGTEATRLVYTRKEDRHDPSRNRVYSQRDESQMPACVLE
jgi:hypothetical protein